MVEQKRPYMNKRQTNRRGSSGALLVELTLLSSNCSGVRPAIKMVEARGVEPLSESGLTRTSPSAVNSLHSLAPAGIDTLCGSVASYYMAWAKLTMRTFTTHRRPSPARGPSGWDGRLIRQPGQLYCCQLILKDTRFIEVRRLCPLIQPHCPRRSHCSPMCAPENRGGK